MTQEVKDPTDNSMSTEAQDFQDADIMVVGNGDMAEDDDNSDYEDFPEDEEAGESHEHGEDCMCGHEQAIAPSLYLEREPNPDLPETVTKLESAEGSTVYLVGTAHFSHNSQDDVAQTIKAVQPDFVMLELCKNRVNILQMDEEMLLKEASDLNWDKIRTSIKQNGVVQGVMHLLLLSMSAHLTRQLGMAPGGEFRRAFREARSIRGCQITLGDRPINITLRRALGSLGWWQKLRLAWSLIMSRDSISKEDVEKCKQKDLLEEMLKEMTGEFPALTHVFVAERDQFMAHSLQMLSKGLPHQELDGEYIPCVVVAVVGIGHVQGIADNWQKELRLDEIMKVPDKGILGSVLKRTLQATLVGLIAWGGYKLYQVCMG